MRRQRIRLAAITNELVRVYMKEAAHKEEGRIVERMKQLKENYRECAEKLRERRQTLLVRQDEIGGSLLRAKRSTGTT